MKISIFTKIISALFLVIIILSTSFIYTSLNNADNWAAKSTIESRDTLRDKYQILFQTLADSLSHEAGTKNQMPNELLSSISKKYPEISQFTIVEEESENNYQQINKLDIEKPPMEKMTDSNDTNAPSDMEESKNMDSADPKMEGSMDSENVDKKYSDNMTGDSKSSSKKSADGESAKTIKLSKTDIESISSGKGTIEYMKQMSGGKGGAHEAMVDAPFLKVIAPIDYSDDSMDRKRTAIIAEISLVKPLEDIHKRHEKTSRYFMNISLIASVVSALIALLVGGIIARGITIPVKKLMRVAEDVSMGREISDIDVKSNDEIGLLADSFQRMVTAVKFLMQQGDD